MRLRSRSDILFKGTLTSLMDAGVEEDSVEAEEDDLCLCGGDEGGGEGRGWKRLVWTINCLAQSANVLSQKDLATRDMKRHTRYLEYTYRPSKRAK